MKQSHAVYDVVKRAVDVVAAAVLLVLLSPVLLVLVLLVLVMLGAPAVFRQKRPGKSGRIFTLYKFRTMREGPHAGVQAVASDAERMTPFGRVLRSTSLDELPELVNILKGDMSFVGPRPLLPEYLDRYSTEQARRHEVRPGVTGWAQVNGRNAVSWDERFKMDVYYVDNRSFALDARILFKTIKTAFSREGVSAPGSETMQPFQGNAEGSDSSEPG